MRTGESIKGRGAAENPTNRFERLTVERDADWDAAEDPAPHTEFYVDRTRSIIAYNDSPDIGFNASINPYRGCEHGCIYCYARPTHEYAGLSLGLDFETKIFVKTEAPTLLRRELSSRHWKPQFIAMSGVTDCYQPVERRLRLTRACLEVLAEARNPVGVITKNHLVTRDIDVLQELARFNAASVALSVTTLRPEITQVMEPRSTMPHARLEAIRQISRAGVPVGIMIAPVIPGLTDHEIPAILQACHDAGASSAGFVLLRLPFGVSHLFTEWLGRHFPDAKEKVLHRIRETRDGKLYDSEWRKRQLGEGVYAEQIAELFSIAKRKAGYKDDRESLSTAHFRRPRGPQLPLFED